MRPSFLLLTLLLVLVSGCLAQPVTPVYVIQYPATWTPGPTATNTPIPPTATLVIQRTPGVRATQDPTVRRLPNAPLNGIGVWLETTDLTPDLLRLLVPRAQIFTGAQALAARQAKLGSLALFDVDAAQIQDPAVQTNFQANAKNERYDGALVKSLAPGAASSTLNSVRSALNNGLLIVGADEWRDGAAYFAAPDAANALTAREDGVLIQDFMRSGDGKIETFKSEDKWIQDVDALAALSSNPNLAVFTATRFPDSAALQPALLQQWFDYSLTSFLLGVNNTHSFFGFQGKGATELLTNPAVTAALGRPLGAPVKTFGVFQRRFTRGVVLVNPTDDEHRVPFSRKYKTVTDNPLTEITLAPHTGIVLLIAD